MLMVIGNYVELEFFGRIQNHISHVMCAVWYNVIEDKSAKPQSKASIKTGFNTAKIKLAKVWIFFLQPVNGATICCRATVMLGCICVHGIYRE